MLLRTYTLKPDPLYFLTVRFRKAKAKLERQNNDQMLDAEDEVRLYEDGWKDRYFRSKFDVSADDHEFRRKVISCTFN